MKNPHSQLHEPGASNRHSGYQQPSLFLLCDGASTAPDSQQLTESGDLRFFENSQLAAGHGFPWLADSLCLMPLAVECLELHVFFSCLPYLDQSGLCGPQSWIITMEFYGL
eukprot:1143080-Pelagomonas_calceolata.AAC.2